MSRKSRNWIILLSVASLTLIADRVSKWIITNNLTPNESWHPPFSLAKRILSLTYTTNTGAAFGLFPDQNILFIVINLLVISIIIYYYRYLPAGYALTRLALGLQLGGALGNLIDRLRQGYVVDFVNLNFWPLHRWPIFNVADSAVVVGACLMALTLLREDPEDLDSEFGSPEGEAASEPGTSS